MRVSFLASFRHRGKEADQQEKVNNGDPHGAAILDLTVETLVLSLYRLARLRNVLQIL
jgi:hypothetical protein